MDQTGQQGMALPGLTNQGNADSHPPPVHAPEASSPPTQQPIRPQINQHNSSHLFHTQNFKFHNPVVLKHQICLRITRPSEYAPDNKLTFPRAPNATLPLFLTTNHPATTINFPLHPSAPPSPNTQQHNSEPAHPNDLLIPNPLFAPILTALIPHAPLINQHLVDNTFQNNTNQVHKVVRSVDPPFPHILNIPLGQHFVPNTSHWSFPKHRPSIVNQDTATVDRVPPNVQAYIAPSRIDVPQQIYSNSPLLIDMQSPFGTQQENPIATSINVLPGLATSVFQPTYPYVGPTPLSWSGPQVSAPVLSIADNA